MRASDVASDVAMSIPWGKALKILGTNVPQNSFT